MFVIRQNATHKVVVGPAVAVGDGFTPVTTLALSSADEAEVILHDNGTVVSISGYTWAAIATADGYYHLTLQTGISGTVGHMTVVVNDDSLVLPLRADFQVIEEAAYDAIYAASAAPATAAGVSAVETDTQNIQSRLPAALVNSRMDATIDGTGMEAAAVAAIADGVWDEAATGHTDAGKAGEQLWTDLDAVLADTNELQTDNTPGALSAIDAKIDTIDDFLDTEVAAIVTATGTTIPGLIGTPADFGSGTSTLAANLQDIADNGTATFDRSTDSLQAIRDRGDAAWTTGGGGSILQVAAGTIGATGNDTTHLHLDGLAYADDALNDLLIVVYDDSASLYYSTWITDWANTGDLATVDTLPFTPEASTDTYVVLAIRQDVSGGSGLDAAGVRDAVGLATANLDTQLAALPTAAEVVNEWETQSQADPTGFHVNVLEVGGTAQTANDIGGDANTLVTEVGKIPKSDGTSSWNATALAAIQGEANDAIVANKLDHLVAVADADDPVDNSIIAKLASKGATADWSSYVNTTDSLEANRDNIGAAGAGLTEAGGDGDHLTEAGGDGDHLVEAGGTGDQLTALATQASVDTIDDLLDTEMPALTTAVADLPTNSELATALASADDAVIAAIAALNNLSSSQAATAVLTTQMTESYAANGAAPTLAQALMAVHQRLMQFDISGTSLSVKKLDTSTTAFVVTLDDADAPTGSSRD